MDKFEVAKMYLESEGNRVGFLKQLKSLPDVRDNKTILEFIKIILNRIHQLASERFFASFNKKGTEVPREYFEYEKTKNFDDDMKTLFSYMQIDDRYFSPAYQKAYAIMREVFGDQDLSNLKLTISGNFDLDGKELNVITAEQFEELVKLAKKDDELNVSKETGEKIERDFSEIIQAKADHERFFVIDMENPVVRKYLPEVLMNHKTPDIQMPLEQPEKTVATPETTVEKEKPGEDMTQDKEAKPEAGKAKTVQKSKPEWIPLKPTPAVQADVKKKLLSISTTNPEQLAKAHVLVTINDGLMSETENKEAYIVRIPKGYHGKNEDFVHTGSTSNESEYFIVQASDLVFKKSANQTFASFEIPLDKTYPMCESDGKLLDKEISAVNIADHFLIKAIKSTIDIKQEMPKQSHAVEKKVEKKQQKSNPLDLSIER